MIIMQLKSKNFTLFDILNYILLFLFALICFYPFYYIFIYSLSMPGDAARGGFYFLPPKFSLINYQKLLVRQDIYSSAFISTLRTLIGTALTVFCSSLMGYLVTKKQLIFRKFIYRAIVITMYLNAGLIPYYITIKTIHLTNNFLIYILPSAVSAFYVILIKTYIEQLPAAVEESAMIDGAKYWRIFISIVFPVCGPIIATVTIFAAVGQWNTWQDNFFFISNPKLNVLQFELWRILNSAQLAATTAQQTGQVDANLAKNMTPVSIRMTITMITTIPIMLVYPLLQRHFIKGILIGAVKG